MKDGQPSKTAQYVAANVVFSSVHPVLGGVLPPDAGRETSRYFRSLDTWTGTGARLFHRLPKFVLRRLIARIPPGVIAQTVLRKRWIQDAVRANLSDCSQVVVLGAGLDTLAPRLRREYPDVRFWEIDHPATQGVKRRVVEQGSNLTLCSEDFTERAPMSSLDADTDYDPDEPTVVVTEGLLMYLSEAEVRELFDAVREHTGEGSHLVGTAINPNAMADGPDWLESANSSRSPTFLDRLGEPWHWVVESGKLSDELDDHGFELTALSQMRHLRAQYLPDRPNLSVYPIEYCFEATREE
ncbi:SAM-dependent methyltransferase [Haladaptatus sp. AB618]|uniref:class I SAM-dependent methyltransferase n=1 Tax=Haladaptatus sp. AB618 TaxID=2934173 RepID=UPI00209BF468|nr:SAM-dependent methyltransferase [Haladaptatus sp. AB618]MCO8254040.1 SAM-dependent methyltransferase [Haladaptatus sp. AB618]